MHFYGILKVHLRNILSTNIGTILLQLLLRICDDVTKLEWHPNEPEILVGGCSNGQLQIWDINLYLPKLRAGECTWDHR